jgi:hypothetical protein
LRPGGGLLALLLLVCLPAALLVCLSPCQGDEAEEVLSFRRQLLPPDRLPQELKRVQNGVLVRLPQAEFDAHVERAARAAARKVPPRLLEARYHAALKDQALIGDGQWKVLHKGPAPGLLPLDPLNLALRQARFENGDALVAAFDGRTPALLVETVGEQTVSLEWSARAETEPEGLRFHLEMPPCPVALLEIDVPAGRTLSMLDDSLVSGPHPAEAADLRRWKIVCGGRRKLDFRVRPTDAPPAGSVEPPRPLVRQKTTQKLYPEGLDAAFELTVEASPRGVRELVCECDPELRPHDIVGPSVEGWSIQAGSNNGPSRLTIRLREAVREGTWQILCLAPLSSSPPAPAGGSRRVVWKSPGMRLVGGVPRGESLGLWFHPDLRLESWDAGSFRLLSSVSEPDSERQATMQHLTLVGGGVGPEGAPAKTRPRRPEARLQAYGVEFRARQLAWWRCDADGMALTVQIGYEVSQGQLFQLPVQLPDNWTVERVEMSPTGLLRGSRVRTGAGHSTLHVDLARPLLPVDSSLRDGRLRPNPLVPPDSSGDGTVHPSTAMRPRVPTLTVHLRPAWSGPVTGRTLPFPDAVPVGARFREGALALDCDAQLFHLDLRTTAERSEPEQDGPWGQHLPEYSYRYRGQPMKGTLRVQPRPPRVRARCQSEVFVASGRAAVETHLLLEAEVGSPDTIEFALSESDGNSWHWRTEPAARGEPASTNRVVRAERRHAVEVADALQVLAARSPLQSALLLATRPTGERWRLTLARPLRAREPLRLSATRPLQVQENGWHVPLPVVLGPGRMEGEVTLHLAGADLVQVQAVGLREAAAAAVDGATPWRTFRYGQAEVRLVLLGQALATGRAGEAVIDRARLITYVRPGGVLQHHFSFQVANWTQRILSLRLPPGARPLAVQVDGRWLPRLLPRASAAGEEEPPAEGEELALPVPGGGETTPAEGMHRFDIVYTRTVPAGLLWHSIEAPAPGLPVEPLAFHRSWRLSAALTPLRDDRYHLMPGTSGAVASAVWPRQPSDLFRLSSVWPQLNPLLSDSQASAREALVQAAEGLRSSHAGQAIPLRELVRDLALVHLKDRYPLVMDTLALREAGIGADRVRTIAPLSADEQQPPWSAYGLTVLPGRSALVLTTLSGRGAALREPFSDSLDEAVAAAAARGQDPSGRFRSALNWLRPENAAAPSAPPRWLGLGADARDWSEWEPVAGLPDDTLIVIHRDLVTGLGLGLVLALGLFFWMIRRRSPRWRITLLFLVLALAGLGVLWLPAALRPLVWWPLLATCGGALVWYLRALVRGPAAPKGKGRTPRNVVAGALPAGAVLFALLGWSSQAAAPAPVLVYLVPGPDQAPENQTVLVPADFLERLKTLARPAPLVEGGPQAVLLGAAYEGTVVGREAEFAAVFTAQCLTDEPALLAIPLDGVQLVGDIWLDGARADPMAAAGPRGGYSLKVRGIGRHKVELRFRTPLVGTSEDRNILFTVPPLVRSRLSWRIPPGAAHTQALVKYGAEWTVRDGAGERLEVDLGRLETPAHLPTPVHLHWYQPAQPARPVRVQFQAAYLWDLHLDASRLTAWLRYRLPEGAARTLEMDLPGELEVRSADIQRTSPASAPAPTWLTGVRLRDWQVVTAGGKRTLRLELPYPVSGDFQVTLELAPRAPLPALVTLPLPAPHGEHGPETHYLAYRTHTGLEAQRDTSQNLTRIDESDFAPDWPGVPRLAPAAPAGPEGEKGRGAVYKISPDRSPLLRLRLHRSPPALRADVEITVQTGTQLAEVRASARLTAPNKDLGVVEWDLQSPRVTVASVMGSDVRAWKQTDQRLLIWLNRTTSASQILLSGWLPLERGGGPAHLDLPGLRLPQAREQHTRVRISAASGLALASVKPHNLQPADGEATDLERNFETNQTTYGVRCEVQAAANAVTRVLTFAEVNAGQVQFTTTVSYEVRHGELRRVQLRLRNWEGKVVREAEGVAQSRELRREPGDRSLRLDLAQGIQGRYRVVLRGSMSVEEALVGVPMPDVTVQGVESAEYILAIAGAELTGEARGGLLRLAQPARMLASWPGTAMRIERAGGQAWRVQGTDWQLRLMPHAHALEPASVRVFLLEQSAAVVDGQRWLHEARCWLRHEAHTDLTVDFPAPVRVVAAALDGVEVTPLQPGSSRLWLPLPGRAGVRCVRLRWLYEKPETLDRPNLAPLDIVDARKGPILWTVLVPPGWAPEQSTPSARLGMGAAREGALALYRAEAQLRISQELCQQDRVSAASTALAAAQRRFALYCRHARNALQLGADHGGVLGPEGQTLADWLQKLQTEDRELAGQNGFDAVRTDAERRSAAGETVALDLFAEDDSVARFLSSPSMAASGADPENRRTSVRPLTQRGTPISWQGRPGTEPPDLYLTSRESQRTRQSLAVSGQWLGVLMVVWVLSFLPFLLARLRLFWPEQIALVAVIGWHLSGPTLIVLLLLLVAGGGRGILLLRGLRSLLRTHRNQPSTMMAGSAEVERGA